MEPAYHVIQDTLYSVETAKYRPTSGSLTSLMKKSTKILLIHKQQPNLNLRLQPRLTQALTLARQHHHPRPKQSL